MIKTLAQSALILLTVACSSGSNDSVNGLSNDTIQKTVWINTPMDEFPDCVDTLKFDFKTGNSYSCEQEETRDFNFEIVNDTLYVERFGYKSEMDTIKQITSKEWFVLSKNGLVWAKVLRLNGNSWSEIDDEYLHKFYFKQL